MGADERVSLLPSIQARCAFARTPILPHGEDRATCIVLALCGEESGYIFLTNLPRRLHHRGKRILLRLTQQARLQHVNRCRGQRITHP